MADELDLLITHYSFSCRKCGEPISYDLPLDNDVVICPSCHAANIHDEDKFPGEAQ